MSVPVPIFSQPLRFRAAEKQINVKRVEEEFQNLIRRCELARRRAVAREPKRAADIMAAVLQRRGYGRFMENEQLAAEWTAIVDARLRPFTRPVRVFRGRLEVLVANSAVMQELTFAKAALVERFNRETVTHPISDIRLRVGHVD
jgi:hypothetical protein